MMELLRWNKDNDNQPEIHGSIGKIHKSLAIYRILYIYSRGLKLRKITIVFVVETFLLFSFRTLANIDNVMKREKEKVKGVTEILCKAKFSREFFASYLYENFFVDTIGWIEKILLVLLLINVKLKIFFYKRKISFLFLYKNTQQYISFLFFYFCFHRGLWRNSESSESSTFVSFDIEINLHMISCANTSSIGNTLLNNYAIINLYFIIGTE